MHVVLYYTVQIVAMSIGNVEQDLIKLVQRKTDSI